MLGHFPPTFRYVLDGLCRWSILYKQRTSFLGWGNIPRYVAKKLNLFYHGVLILCICQKSKIIIHVNVWH